jgi:hypothetical protein
MGAAPRYTHIPKSDDKKTHNSPMENEKKQVQETIEKIKDLIDSSDKAKKAAQIIEEMLRSSK